MLSTVAFYLTAASGIAVVGYTITNVLMQPGHVLAWYYDLLDRLAYDPYKGPRRFACLAKPFGHCDICLTGQLALWYFLLFLQPYRPDCHIVFVCLAIAIIHTFKKLLRKWGLN